MYEVVHTVFPSSPTDQLGRIDSAGIIQRRVEGPKPLRDLGRYAAVLLTDGHGTYTDTGNNTFPVVPGDVIILFPGLPHSYGPEAGQTWSELYVVFSGETFYQWERSGVLDRSNPHYRIQPVAFWYDRLRSLLFSSEQSDPVSTLHRFTRFQVILTEILTQRHVEGQTRDDTVWLEHAKASLRRYCTEKDKIHVAANDFGLSYQVFRKRFTRLAGISPGRFCSTERINRAIRLLVHDGYSVKATAFELGFRDEYHFSRRFKEIVGLAPSKYVSHFGRL